MRYLTKSIDDEVNPASRLLPAFIGMLILVVAIGVMGNTVHADSKETPTCTVTFFADGAEFDYATTASTVAGVLKEAGIEVGEKDELYPKAGDHLYNKMRIRVVRVMQKTEVKREPIKFRTIRRFNPSGIGGKAVHQKGENGEKEVTYLHIFRDGADSETRVIGQKVLKAPVNEESVVTRSEFIASRSGSSLRSLQMVATAYDPSPRCCGPRATGRTANGTHAGYGVVAVDPRIIRLGTKLYVEGYGFCVAADTGGAIKGNRIDLCFNSYSEAVHFGRRLVTVYILE